MHHEKCLTSRGGVLISKSANGDHDSRPQGQVVGSFRLLNKRLEATAFQGTLSPGMLCWVALAMLTVVNKQTPKFDSWLSLHWTH
jgi:hypothetical protein